MGTRVIGLTGGIGSGKSTVAGILAGLGARVVDADRLAREVVEPGRPALEEIRRRFGDDVLGPDGALDRRALGARIFDDPAARRDLEAITHPRIREEALRRVEEARQAGVEIVVYEAALLVETGLHRALDGLIVVAVDPETQVRRVSERDGLDPGAVRRRMAAQLPLAEKVEAADYVVDNTGTLQETERQVRRIWQELTDGKRDP